MTEISLNRTSRDYDGLQALLDAGLVIVCLADYRFPYGDTRGDGWCELHREPRHCSNYCEDRLPK